MSIATNDPAGPRFYLLNANGPTLFRRAVRMAVELKVDVILFSGTFEGLGSVNPGLIARSHRGAFPGCCPAHRTCDVMRCWSGVHPRG